MKKAYVYVKGYTNPKDEKYTAVFVQLYFCILYATKKFKITIFSDEVTRGVLPHSEFQKMLGYIKTSKVRNVVIFPDILTVDEMCELLSLNVRVHIIDYEQIAIVSQGEIIENLKPVMQNLEQKQL